VELLARVVGCRIPSLEVEEAGKDQVASTVERFHVVALPLLDVQVMGEVVANHYHTRKVHPAYSHYKAYTVLMVEVVAVGVEGGKEVGVA
jgi:hypothetical protein